MGAGFRRLPLPSPEYCAQRLSASEMGAEGPARSLNATVRAQRLSASEMGAAHQDMIRQILK